MCSQIADMVIPRSIASSYEFQSPIKRFDKGTRDIFHVELVNGETYIFKPYRPEDEDEEPIRIGTAR